MNEQQAKAIAKALDGEAWQSGGGIWLVTVARSDGAIVAISDESICEYADDEALDVGKPVQSILLVGDVDDGRQWVVQDADGTVILREPDLRLGWRFKEDAEHEAMAIESRTGIHTWVRELMDDDPA